MHRENYFCFISGLYPVFEMWEIRKWKWLLNFFFFYATLVKGRFMVSGLLPATLGLYPPTSQPGLQEWHLVKDEILDANKICERATTLKIICISFI